MANSIRTHQDFLYENQNLNGTFLDAVKVGIFKPLETVFSNNWEKVVATDGLTIQKSKHTSRKHTSDYTYVVLSSGICKDVYRNFCSLKLKVYLTDDFDLSMLEKCDFLGKDYVIKSIKTYFDIGFLPPFLNHLYKKAGDDYLILYHRLKNVALAYRLDKVEQLFKEYKISDRNQALFWKETYQETRQKKVRKNYKLRWKGLLQNQYPYATVNVKMSLKKETIFIHERDLVFTDGQVQNSFVYNFSYVLVRKSIKRQETPGTWHLDIKIYVRDFFDPKYLPKITAFWGEYVHEVINKYLPNLKK